MSFYALSCWFFVYFVSAALFASFLVFFQVLQRDLSWLATEPNERGGRVDNGPNRRDSNALGAAVRYSEYLEVHYLLPDVRVISMFGFLGRCCKLHGYFRCNLYGRVMPSSEFLDVEPETWPRYFCESLGPCRGFLGSSLLCKQRVAICWNAGFASRGTRNKQSRQTSTVPVFRLILCTRFCAWTKRRFRSIHPKSLHKMQLYNLPTDFSIVVFRDIATGKRRIIGYFTWKQLSPWAMEVCNPSFLPFCRHLEVEFSIPQKPVFFWGEGNLREKREAPTCCSAAWLSFPTKRQQQLSAVQADPPGFLVRRLVIPGILARCPLEKSRGFLALGGFQWSFCLRWSFCNAVCLLKRCQLSMMSVVTAQAIAGLWNSKS